MRRGRSGDGIVVDVDGRVRSSARRRRVHVEVVELVETVVVVVVVVAAAFLRSAAPVPASAPLAAVVLLGAVLPAMATSDRLFALPAPEVVHRRQRRKRDRRGRVPVVVESVEVVVGGVLVVIGGGIAPLRVGSSVRCVDVDGRGGLLLLLLLVGLLLLLLLVLG